MSEYHKNDPLHPDNVLSDGEEKLLTIIDDVESPEQLAAAKEIFLGEKPAEEPPKGKGEGEEVTKSEEKPGETKEPDKSAEKPEKIAEPGEKKVIEITDDYISQADEKDRQILTSLKGETMSEKALKNYIEGQRLIGKKSTEIQKLKEPEERKPREVHINDEQRTLISSMAKKELRKTFKDMPEDPEDQKEWVLRIQNSDPDEAERYYDEKRRLTEELTEQYKQVLYVRENYDLINMNTMQKEIEMINEFFKDHYGITPEDIGLKLEVDAEFSNEIINKLLTLPNGDFDPRVVTYYDTKNQEVPIINEGALAEKFVRTYGKNAVEEVRKRARKEGFEARDSKKTIKELTDISFEKSGDAKTEVLKIEDIEDMDDLEKVRSLIEKVEPLIK